MTPISVNVQSSIRIEGQKIIYFDPIEVPATADADYIFITHSHWDHFSLVSILELRKPNTVFVIPKDLVEELLSIGISEEYIVSVRPNQTYSFKNIEFRTIPAYNLKKAYHKRSQDWVGYIVNYEKVIYYIAGDTDLTKEALEVKCDVAFLPVGGTYTMNYLDAAKLANTIKPKLVIPIHYGYAVGTIDDAKSFQKRLDKDIECLLLLEGGKNDNN